jgi:serine protease Do
LAVLVAVLVYPSIPSSAAECAIDPAQREINAAVDAVRPALVRIHIVSTEDREGREVKEESFGSGVIIAPEGYVVTNHHVAGHAKQISCTLTDKSEVDATLVGTDAATDISVIKLKNDGKKSYPIAKFGDSSALRVGDRAFAMGCPLSLSQSVTMGIISNTELVMPEMFGEFSLDGEDVGSMVRWIGHCAIIQPGNSGGPLVNMNGEVVGINEIDIGLSGAIPGNLVKDISSQLMRNGRIKRSWLGISVQPLLKSSTQKTGALVGGVIDGSPASKAGLKSGDILTSIDGKPCSVRFAEEQPVFNLLIANLTPGKEIEIQALRDGKQISFKATPTLREPAAARPSELKEWGICASNITAMIAKEKRREGTAGVLVTSTREGGPAAEAKPSISGEDIITTIGGKPVKDMDDFRRITAEIVAGKTEPVPTLVGFEQHSDKYLTVVKIGLQDFKDAGLEVRKAWLPVQTQVLSRDMAESMNINDKTGVRVTQVYPNSTAQKAGLKVGDIIVAIDGTAIQASEPEDGEVFPTMVREYKIGATPKFTVIRDGKEQPVTVELVAAPKLAREMKKHRDENFDLTVRDICFFDRVDQHWSESQPGVIVQTVDEGGWSSLGGLSSNDLIVDIDGEKVVDVAGFEAQMKKISDEKPKTVIFHVKHGIHEKYAEIQPVWPAH